MRRKNLLVSLLCIFVVFGSVNAATVSEIRFDNGQGEFTQDKAWVTDQDTLQKTHPDHLLVQSKAWDPGANGWVPTDGPMWGNVKSKDAVKDAGSEWWAFGGMTTIGGIGALGDGYLDFRWTDDYEYHPAFDGWDLDRIEILVGDNTLFDRTNYKFRVEVLSHDWLSWTTIDMSDDAGQQDWLTGGSDRKGVGTKIIIDDINISDIRGFRITSNGLWQASYDNAGNSVTPFWGNTHISEIDVFLTPEPATMVLFGLGGLFIARRKRS